MSNSPDYKLDVAGIKRKDEPSGPRPFLSVHFACCSVYQRIYRNKEGTEYSGRCPRCGKQVRFGVGEGGTDARQFVVY